MSGDGGNGDNNDEIGSLDDEIGERMIATRIVSDYIQSIFPAVYSTTTESTSKRLYTEIKSEHLVMRMFNEKNPKITDSINSIEPTLKSNRKYWYIILFSNNFKFLVDPRNFFISLSFLIFILINLL